MKKQPKNKPHPSREAVGAVPKYFTYVMNNTRKTPQKSSIFPENPYSATGYHDKKIASPIEALLSKIKANFGKISQNSLNFAARVGLNTAQNPNTHRKTTANKARRGFTLCN